MGATVQIDSNNSDFIGDNPNFDLLKSPLQSFFQHCEELGILLCIFNIHNDADVSVFVARFLMRPFTEDWLG